jgi:hypothetical protein
MKFFRSLRSAFSNLDSFAKRLSGRSRKSKTNGVLIRELADCISAAVLELSIVLPLFFETAVRSKVKLFICRFSSRTVQIP